MISLKAIQTSFTTSHGPFPERETFRKRRFFLALCKSNTSSDNSDEETPPPPPQGDSRKQELLVKIAMLQTQKVRLTGYLDERSAYLTQFAEEANAEMDQIGENALKELDEAGARIMENIESKMQAFEESVELNKSEIEESEKVVADFEGQIEDDRNEGLFFKNLREKKPVDKAIAMEEAMKITELTRKTAGSIIRKNIYLALIVLVGIGIADASLSSAFDWKKVAVLGVILVGLLSQLIYEQSMLAKTDKVEQEKSEESK
ncbi:hypothetical protein ABFS82_10G021200 [Erythranthe guttata]|uniref:8-amino-7-oxononanoate synthase n=1 Tax=Erythranthe guttata TaxID=4155 RepID=A0A022RSC7_ERYGU|nr:PREDICTED: uncharacterized protein LOC105953040 [Erythranthe guttata]EYU41840.1 hypothetical protein MIMGU_mgv1a012149mg [Erythranthe guttata]|eukprot:XP_012832113.1 PREDICTED: uncharacterized protein LOC105953040 [Erythranthe guttata]